MKRIRGRAVLAGAGILAAGFAWGVASQREGVFPHDLLRRAAIRLGFRVWQHEPLELRSRSPHFGIAASIPYLDGQADSATRPAGVVLDESGSADPGVNFYSVPGRRAAYLIDMRGKLLWRWSLARYPGYARFPPNTDVGFTHLYPNGDVLVYVERHALFRLDKDSRVLWHYDAFVHHDAWVEPDGTIDTLVKHQRIDPRIHPEAVLLADAVERLTPEGHPTGEIPLLDVVERSPDAFLLPQPPPGTNYGSIALDVLHANHVEVYDGSLARLSPLFRRGNILVSLKDLDSVMILDGSTHRVLWVWGPTNVVLQHHATIVPNGDVMIFDNGRQHSRVVEVDPRTNRVVWTYSNGSRRFHSYIRGSCQRLSNGNTLICVSQAGFAVEVTPAGRIVWKFVDPDVDPVAGREAIFRMTRYDPAQLPFLRGRAAGGPAPRTEGR